MIKVTHDQFRDHLVKSYPCLFAAHPPFFGCSTGWFAIIDELCCKLEPLVKAHTFDFPFEVFDIKEKYGGLRFYTSSATDEMYDLITEYAEKSKKTCENCGSNDATIRNKGWITTLCGECWKSWER